MSTSTTHLLWLCTTGSQKQTYTTVHTSLPLRSWDCRGSRWKLWVLNGRRGHENYINTDTMLLITAAREVTFLHLSVCLSVCLSVRRITQKLFTNFDEIFGVVRCATNNRSLKFCWWSGLRCGSRNVFIGIFTTVAIVWIFLLKIQKLYEAFYMKFLGGIGCLIWNKLLHLGADLEFLLLQYSGNSRILWDYWLWRRFAVSEYLQLKLVIHKAQNAKFNKDCCFKKPKNYKNSEF